MDIEIFLDTNVFESAQFSYGSENMLNFIEYCRENAIQLKITDVVEYEVKKRIKANIADFLEPINKNIIGIVNASIGIDTSITKIKLIEQLTQKLVDDFTSFIEDNNVKILESNCEILNILEKYFRKVPPFSEQKKHEFPDAIILETIKKYISENKHKTIITVSNDNDFKEFCEVNKIENYSYISNALSSLIQKFNEELVEAYQAYQKEIEKNIFESIKESDDFILYSYDSLDEVYVDDIKCEPKSINNLNITEINKEINSLFLMASVSVEFSCTAYYPDPDSLHYDKEDSIYYSFSQCESKIQFTENIDCEIEIAYEKSDNSELILNMDAITIHDKEFEFFLDEKYIISTKYEEDSQIRTF